MSRRETLQLTIHGFALLHALTAALCYATGINDALFLTILTMTMSVLICTRNRVRVEITAISIILVNIVGYVIGVGIGQITSQLINSAELSPAVATFITTEFLGWSIAWFTGRFKRDNGDSWKMQFTWTIVALIAIFIFRIMMSFLFEKNLSSGGTLFDAIFDFTSNTSVLISMILISVVCVRLKRNHHVTRQMYSLLIHSSMILLCAMLGTLVAKLGIPYGLNPLPPARELIETFIIALIAECAIYCITYLADYAIGIKKEMEAEKAKANQAMFQYLNLKQQLNPHFLFNSLNVLDGLVLDGSRQEASIYIHKLSGLYRYMLQHEEENIVTLREEMEYVTMYTDLLKVRFQDDLVVRFDIPETYLSKSVIACSIQLLLENATKHNKALKDAPLVVDIVCDEEKVTVTNNINPKMTHIESIGLGLTYIKKQYLEFSGKPVEITNTGEKYIVSLPMF